MWAALCSKLPSRVRFTDGLPLPRQMTDAAQKIQRVYSEWCAKAAEIILASRVEDPDPGGDSRGSSFSFNLRIAELFSVRKEATIAKAEFFQLKTQRSFQLEIFLGGAGEEEEGSAASADEQLLERWTFTFFPAANPEPGASDRSNATLVRKMSVTLRSLLCFTRMLPAHAFCKGGANGPRRWRFRVEAWPPSKSSAAQEEAISPPQEFASLQSSVGTLRLSVSQRKDLQAPPQQQQLGTARSSGVSGWQIEQIDLQEGYFAAPEVANQTAAAAAPAATPAVMVVLPPAATQAAPSGTGGGEVVGSFRRLGKIAEEPADRSSGDGSGPRSDGQGSPTAAAAALAGGKEPCLGDASVSGAAAVVSPSGGISSGAFVGGVHTRPRGGSDDSAGSRSTSSKTSRAHSLTEANVMALGGTPPLAAVGYANGPQPPATLRLAYDSACSSRSPTPQSTPQLGPQPEPPFASPSSPLQGGVLGQASANSAEQQGLGAGGPPPVQRLDDLSSLWMTPPPEWGRRRTSRTLSTLSRDTRSRSPSPEEILRNQPAASRTSSVSSARGRTLTGGGGGTASTNLGAAKSCQDGEIWMFGISDDDVDSEEGDDDPEDEFLFGRNIVASAIQEGGEELGAFASQGVGKLGSLDAEVLGLLGPPDGGGGGGVAETASTRSSPHLGPADPPKLMSPLIAQLNPFQQAPNLDLPPPAFDLVGLSPPADSAAGSSSHPGPDPQQLFAADDGDGTPTSGARAQERSEVQPLLVDMGDLVCRLQQRQDLDITLREELPEDMLERLEHFREVARAQGLARKCS